MYILRTKKDNRVMFIDPEQKVLLVCRDKESAEKGVEEIQQRFGIDCKPEPIDEMKLAGLWCLRKHSGTRTGRLGREYGPEKGIRVAFRNRKDAQFYANRIYQASEIVTVPVPA